MCAFYDFSITLTVECTNNKGSFDVKKMNDFFNFNFTRVWFLIKLLIEIERLKFLESVDFY